MDIKSTETQGMRNLETKKVLSLNISTGSYDSFLNTVSNLSKQQKSSYVCLVNVHSVVEASNKPDFKNIINNADIAAPDGMPVAKSIKLLYGIEQKRVAGMDIFPDLLKKASDIGLSVFFYGSTDKVLKKIIEKAKKELPALKISGSFSPPFRDLSENEKNETADMINNAESDIIFVSLGCPKQEIWMADMKNKLKKGVMVGVGAAFPVYAGTVKRAYKWMQNLSLEWLFRLFQEPKRLLRRYLYTNTYFLFLLSKEIIGVKIFRKK